MSKSFAGLDSQGAQKRGRRSRQHLTQPLNPTKISNEPEELNPEANKRAALEGIHGFAGGGGDTSCLSSLGTSQAAKVVPENDHAPKRTASISCPTSEAPIGGEIYTNTQNASPPKVARAARFCSDLQHAVGTTTAVHKVVANGWQPATGFSFSSSAAFSSDNGFVAEHIIGTCDLMCPPGERELRERKNDIELFERVDPLHRNASHPALCIKKYTRIVDNVTPDMVRTRAALTNAVAQLYSLLDSRPEVPFVTKSKFLWDRLRSVRQDLSLQAITDGFAVRLLEEMVRFAIMSEHELCEETVTVANPDGHNSHLNVEQLAKTLTSLRHMYDDHAQRGILPGKPGAEAEMFAYQLLLRIDSHGRYNVERREMLNDLRSAHLKVLLSPDVQLALAAHRAYHANNIIAFFWLVQNATYLQACVLHKYFSRIRSRVLETMNATFGKQEMPMKEVARLLQTDVPEAEALALHHGLTVTRSADWAGTIEMLQCGASQDESQTFLKLRESGFIHPVDEFQILRSSLVDRKRAARYLDDIDPLHMPRNARLSTGGGVGLATDSIVESKVVATTFSATLEASVYYASKGARRSLNSEASLFVPSDGTKTEIRRPLLLAPTELAGAALSEAARSTVGVGGLASTGFLGEQCQLETADDQMILHGRLTPAVSVRTRQSATEAAAERLRTDIAAKEIEMRKRRDQRGVTEPNGHTCKPQASKFLALLKDVSHDDDIEGDHLRELGVSGKKWERVVRPPLTLPSLERNGLSRTHGKLKSDMRKVSTQGDASVLLDVPRVFSNPQSHPKALARAQKHAVELPKSERQHSFQEVDRMKDVEACPIDTTANDAVVEWDKERGGVNPEATVTERGQHEMVGHTGRATTGSLAAVATTAMEEASLARRAENFRVARLRLTFAQWWAHSRIQANNRHEGRITVSRAGATPTPSIHPSNTSTSASLLQYITPDPPLVFSTARSTLRGNLAIPHTMPWGAPLDIPKIIFVALVGDGQESLSPQSRCLGEIAHWKLLVCSGGERICGDVKRKRAQDRSPLATMVADWLRAKLSRGGGKGECPVCTDVNGTDGTVLSLYASRIDDGFSASASVVPNHLDFAMHTAGVMSHPTPTASSVLWVCVRDVPTIAATNSVPLSTRGLETTRSDASTIVVVVDLGMGDVHGAHDLWDSANVVPEVEEERLKGFIASLPKPQDDTALNSAVPVLVLVVTGKAVNANATITSVDATVSAALDHHYGVQRHAICVKLLQSPLLGKDDRAPPAAFYIAWDVVLEDGLRWAAALAPPVPHLRAAKLRDQVVDALLPIEDALATSIAVTGTARSGIAPVKAPNLDPQACVTAFNNAVQQVRCRIIGASSATVTAGTRPSVDSGAEAGTRFGTGRLPCEFLAAGSATSLEWAAENCTDVLLSVLDGAVLPPFPLLDDLSVSLAATGANTHDVVSLSPTTHLRRYLSKLNLSEAPQPGATASLLAKAGCADAIIDHGHFPEIDDRGGGWLTIFREVFAYRLIGIETAQKASGVGPAYIFPRAAQPTVPVPTMSACYEPLVQSSGTGPPWERNPGSSPQALASAFPLCTRMAKLPDNPLDTITTALHVKVGGVNEIVHIGTDRKYEALYDGTSTIGSCSTSHVPEVVGLCMDICTTDQLLLKRKRSTVGVHTPWHTLILTDMAGETHNNSYGSMKLSCTSTMAQSLSSARTEVDALELWLVGAAAMDASQSIWVEESTTVTYEDDHCSDAGLELAAPDEMFSLFEHQHQREHIIAES